VKQGFGELIFTGLPTAVFFPGGSLIEGGVIGVGQATYTTLPETLLSTFFSQLLALLDAQGVDVFQSATALSIFSDEPDAASLIGAITFASNDPVLSFDVAIGSVVPEPSSGSLLLAGIGGILAFAACRNYGMKEHS